MLGDSRAHLGDHYGMDDADLEQLLASYYRVCAEAGVDALPDDEARESAKAKAMISVLLPAFAVEFRQH